jgi:hypothetical protein
MSIGREADKQLVLAGIASVSCFGVLVFLLFDRGGTDWSRSYTYFWWLLWASAFLFALVAIVSSASPSRPNYARVIGLTCGFATLGLSALLGVWIMSIASSVT